MAEASEFAARPKKHKAAYCEGIETFESGISLPEEKLASCSTPHDEMPFFSVQSSCKERTEASGENSSSILHRLDGNSESIDCIEEPMCGPALPCPPPQIQEPLPSLHSPRHGRESQEGNSTSYGCCYVEPPSPGNIVPRSVPLEMQDPAWSVGFLDCWEDKSTCCITGIAPCITFGWLAWWMDKRYSSCVFHGIVYCFLCLLGVQCCCSYRYRTKIRDLYNLPGSVRSDFAVHCCCERLALCQEFSELKSRQESRAGDHLDELSAAYVCECGECGHCHPACTNNSEPLIDLHIPPLMAPKPRLMSK